MSVDLEKSLGDGSIYFYLSTEGINIVPEDPIVGTRTCLLNEQTDHTIERRHPYIGEVVRYCHLDEEEGKAWFTPSNWVVFHVEVFPGNGIVREVVVAWCEKRSQDPCSKVKQDKGIW